MMERVFYVTFAERPRPDPLLRAAVMRLDVGKGARFELPRAGEETECLARWTVPDSIS
jgi:hypothetical protein